MALALSIFPTISECFTTLKTYLDSSVYDVKPTAIPEFKEMKIIGIGATPFSQVILTDGENVIGRLIANEFGGFEYTFEPNIKDTNRFRAESGGEKSSMLVFDTYKMHLVIYLYAREYLSILQSYAQAKQDLYIFDRVGDSVEPLFDTEKDDYTTPLANLIDKCPIELPFDVWDQSKDPGFVAQKAIEISEKGPVHASLYALKDIFAEAGCTAIFLNPYETYQPLNLDVNHIPRRHPTDPNKVLIKKGAIRRYRWSMEPITNSTTDKTIAMPTGATQYVWLYVDGQRDPDGSLTVLTSTSQPIPQALATTGTFLAIEVKYDNEDGDVTGIPYQAYVELDPPAFAMSWSFKAEDEASLLPSAEMVSRNIVALGAGSPTGIVTIEYDYYSEPMILCVVRVDTAGNILDFYRSWSRPGHIRTCYPHELANLEIYAKFDVLPSDELISVLFNVLDSIRLISHPMQAFVTSVLDDQTFVYEDGPDWSSQYKGFKRIGVV